MTAWRTEKMWGLNNPASSHGTCYQDQTAFGVEGGPALEPVHGQLRRTLLFPTDLLVWIWPKTDLALNPHPIPGPTPPSQRLPMKQKPYWMRVGCSTPMPLPHVFHTQNGQTHRWEMSPQWDRGLLILISSALPTTQVPCHRHGAGGYPHCVLSCRWFLGRLTVQIFWETVCIKNPNVPLTSRFSQITSSFFFCRSCNCSATRTNGGFLDCLCRLALCTASFQDILKLVGNGAFIFGRILFFEKYASPVHNCFSVDLQIYIHLRFTTNEAWT